jgi:hypothetical protein
VARELDAMCYIFPSSDFHVAMGYTMQSGTGRKLVARFVNTPQRNVDVNIPNFLHERGVNLRHLGLVYQHLTTTYWKSTFHSFVFLDFFLTFFRRRVNFPFLSDFLEVILNYIFARVAKNTLKIMWKRTVEEMEGVSNIALSRSTIEYLNLLLGMFDFHIC